MPKGGGRLRPFDFAQGRLSSRDRKVAATFPGAARAKVGNVTAHLGDRLERHPVTEALL